jgi:type IV secretion system protein VirD4
LLQVEDIRLATGGKRGLLNVRDLGFFAVDVPNFWERPEWSGMLRDIREKPDRYEHLKTKA